MIKMQLLDDLRPEVERMRTLVEKAYADDKEIKAIANTSMQFHRFYQGMPEVSIMPAPGFAEFSGVAVDMPALTTFVHRAMSSMADLNARVSSRNHLISDHAKENGGDGLSSIRLLYFASMLSDEGNNCVEIAENAMAFFVLVRDQLDNYFTHGIRLEGFTSYIFPDEVQKRLPKEERFPKLREQFRDFAAHPLSQ